MSVTDVLLLAIRWIHVVSAVAWVGGGIFYVLVLRPNLKSSPEGSDLALRRIGEQFRHLVNTAIAVLLVTGIILTLSRLTSDHGGMPYVVVLVIKIGLALYMFYLVRFLRLRIYSVEVHAGTSRLQRLTGLFTGATTVLVMGVIVFLLADILQALVENGLSG